MGRRPKTAEEYNLQNIRRNLILLGARKITVKEAGLNRKFQQLKNGNIGMYEELYPKYITTVKRLNNLTLRT